jgi:hypothetical protein
VVGALSRTMTICGRHFVQDDSVISRRSLTAMVGCHFRTGRADSDEHLGK